ncbi:hypothetical protein LUZ60_003186 [Juncus effusus]|nr:hypothetical protein LUZ60_003186 [Juncus effusus]
MKPDSDPHAHHGRHQLRLAVPPRAATFPPSTPSPLPTPSKTRRRAASRPLSSLFVLLFSLRSFYSLLPFVRSAPSSFSLFPFSFLVSLLSFLSLLPFSPSLSSFPLSRPHLVSLASKSLLLSLTLLLRFHSLRYCSAGASILADFAGSLLAKSLFSNLSLFKPRRIIGLMSLTLTIILLSLSWDRLGCFPLSNSFPSSSEECTRIFPMLMPFLAGFLGFFEQNTASWAPLRQLGKRRVRVLSLALTTVFLFIPALVSFLSSQESDPLSLSDLGWPLLNTVLFCVILSESFNGEEKKNDSNSNESPKTFLITFFCTLALQLFYFPNLSLTGFSLCGFSLYIAVLQLAPSSLTYLQLGHLDDSPSFFTSFSTPLKHILSSRKSRKILAFLLINTIYMVIEFIAGFMSNSLGLISDACHMLFDCAALAIGLYASYYSRLPSNFRFNYGRARFEILSGYVNAVFLVLVGALIVLESFERILDPMEISTESLLAVSVGGLVVNVIGLIFFHEEHHHAHGGMTSCSHHHDSNDKHNHHKNEEKSSHTHHEHDEKLAHNHHDHDKHHHDHDKHRHDSHIHNHHCNHSRDDNHNHNHDNHKHVDHNMEGIFLHVLADTMGSVGVVISTLLIKYKGWLISDPICSVFISVMIISSVLPLLRNSAEILLQRVPRGKEKEIKKGVNEILKIEGVKGVNDLHVWNFTNSDIVGTCHVCVSENVDRGFVLKRVLEVFGGFGVKDLTVQFENVRN